MSNRSMVLAALALFVLATPALRSADIPRKAPGFAISLPDGGKVTLAQQKGKVVALAFILTTCPHCQMATAALSRCQAEYGARGFQALGSAIESGAAQHMAAFASQFKPAFPVGFSESSSAMEFMRIPFGVNPMMPLVAFIDRQGMIRAQYMGDDPALSEAQMEKTFRDRIEELLRPAAPARKNKKK